jgi:hypothetical protein
VSHRERNLHTNRENQAEERRRTMDVCIVDQWFSEEPTARNGWNPMDNVGDLNCNPKWSHEPSKIRYSFTTEREGKEPWTERNEIYIPMVRSLLSMRGLCKTTPLRWCKDYGSKSWIMVLISNFKLQFLFFFTSNYVFFFKVKYLFAHCGFKSLFCTLYAFIFITGGTCTTRKKQRWYLCLFFCPKLTNFHVSNTWHH